MYSHPEFTREQRAIFTRAARPVRYWLAGFARFVAVVSLIAVLADIGLWGAVLSTATEHERVEQMNVLHVRVSDALHGAVQEIEKGAKGVGVEVGELHEHIVQMGVDTLNAVGLDELAKHIEAKRKAPIEPAAPAAQS